MKKTTLLAVLIMVVITGQAIAGPNWISGNVTYYTSNTAGLLIMVDDGVPDNCAGTPYGWMIIAAEDKTMLAVALMRISQDKMGVSLYSTGAFYSGYCRVAQYEPAD